MEATTIVTAVDVNAMTDAHLRRHAHEALARRRETYESLQTPEEVAAYQARLRAYFLEALGEFPEAGMLDPRLVGEIEGDGYRVEKVIFQSQPGHHITASVYVPDGEPPFPAVLVPCGHAEEGKASDLYQRACILLARNGMLAMCYDPIGQGERHQILNADGTRKYGCTMEHTILDVGSILLGTTTARFRIHDGLRAIDYLCARDDVDATRIGCTGNSGGGTMTSYLMALDDRIVCAAPSCFLTSLDRLLDTRGVQDGEQNIHGDVAVGMDHADFVIMRAPKPTLMCTATRDFFDIEGSWDSFRQAKRIYTRLGYAERVDLVETDATHGFSRQLRIGMARWMSRWLRGVDAPIDEPDMKTLPQEALWCTPEGQVLLMDGERSTFQLNVDLAERQAEQRRAWWTNATKSERQAKVRQLIGIEGSGPWACTAEPLGVIQRDGYVARRWLLGMDAGLALPALAFEPPEPTQDAYLYLHGLGKEADAGIGGPMEALAQQGHLVLSLDLSGLGDGTVGHPRNALLAYRLNTSLLAMRARDMLAAADLLTAYAESEARYRVHVIAVGAAGPAALHAAFLEPGTFASLALRDAPRSWHDVVVAGDVPPAELVNAAHGVLAFYDWPDLLDAADWPRMTRT